LLSKVKDIPLIWKVLANKYRDDFAFANHCDLKGKFSEALGYDAGTRKESKILVYPAGSTEPSLFDGTRSLSSSNPDDHFNFHAGTLKYNSISNFFNSVLDGSANLTARNTQVPKESHKPMPEEQKIGRKQMDDSDKEEEDTNEREEDIVRRAIRIHLEKEERETTDAYINSLHKTGKTDPAVLEQRTATETAHPFNTKALPQTSETSNPGTVTGSVAPSCASLVSEREPLPTPEDTTSEPGRVKDEL
jgi:protein disulfide-isomerase A6